MKRLLGFLLHNWPLKLSAVVVATVLYAGLVLSQNARTWPGSVPIQVLNQPRAAFILTELPEVTGIRFFAPTRSIEGLSSAAFNAWIDLANVEIDPAQPFITADVHLSVSDDDVNILEFRPRTVTLRLDPVVTRDVPVQVAHGVVPEGLQPSPAQLSQPSVTLTGPESVVSQAVAAEARIRIQPSGIDVDQLVDLIAVDARGEQLAPVEIQPSAVRVRIEVSAEITTNTVPVAPVVVGTPAGGYALDSVSVSPALVTISGDADVLATITSVPTRPVSIDGVREDVSTTADLDLPAGITAAGPGTVRVRVVLVERDSTRSFAAGVVLDGAEPDRTYSLGAESVLVTIGGSERAVNAVVPGSFTATVDVGGVGEGQHDLPVRVELPDGVTLVAVVPVRVTVFIGPRATPPPTPTPTPSPTPSPTPTPTPQPSPTDATQTAVPTGSPSPSPDSPSPSPDSPSPSPSP